VLVGWAGLGALLGPEGTGVHAFGLLRRGPGSGIFALQADLVAIPHRVLEVDLRVLVVWWWLGVGSVRVLRTA
jgi:hypothetical protein